jgi:hypothetical protein
MIAARGTPQEKNGAQSHHDDRRSAHHRHDGGGPLSLVGDGRGPSRYRSRALEENRVANGKDSVRGSVVSFGGTCERTVTLAPPRRARPSHDNGFNSRAASTSYSEPERRPQRGHRLLTSIRTFSASPFRHVECPKLAGSGLTAFGRAMRESGPCRLGWFRPVSTSTRQTACPLRRR